MAVRMRFDANGKRLAINPCEAVIFSHARLTYEQASRWLDDQKRECYREGLRPEAPGCQPIPGGRERRAVSIDINLAGEEMF